MSFFIVNGFIVPEATIPVVEGGAEERIEWGGSDTRAFAGNLLTETRWEASQWTITTGFLTNEESDTLRRACAYGREVTCSGTLIDRDGGELTCVIRLEAGAFITTAADDGTNVLRSWTLVVREVLEESLFAYAPGSSLGAATFTRASTAMYTSEG